MKFARIFKASSLRITMEQYLSFLMWKANMKLILKKLEMIFLLKNENL